MTDPTEANDADEYNFAKSCVKYLINANNEVTSTSRSGIFKFSPVWTTTLSFNKQMTILNFEYSAMVSFSSARS